MKKMPEAIELFFLFFSSWQQTNPLFYLIDQRRFKELPTWVNQTASWFSLKIDGLKHKDPLGSLNFQRNKSQNLTFCYVRLIVLGCNY